MCVNGNFAMVGVCMACTKPATCLGTTNGMPCIGSSLYCTSCNGGYYIVSGACSACSSQPTCMLGSDLTSITCVGAGLYACSSCDDGSYSMSGLCTDCPQQALCMTSQPTSPCTTSNEEPCTTCMAGYWPGAATAICAACTADPNCAPGMSTAGVTCISPGLEPCTGCNGGYFVASQACTACTAQTLCTTSAMTAACTGSNEYQCTLCNNGYYPNGGVCTVCTAQAGCTAGKSVPTAACVGPAADMQACTVGQCSTGYYEQSPGLCTACLTYYCGGSPPVAGTDYDDTMPCSVDTATPHKYCLTCDMTCVPSVQIPVGGLCTGCP